MPKGTERELEQDRKHTERFPRFGSALISGLMSLLLKGSTGYTQGGLYSLLR